VVSGIQYDGGTKEVVLRWRAEVVGAGEGDEVRIRVEKEPVVKQERPGIERPAAAQIGGRLPRITRLLALAVRFARRTGAGRAGHPGADSPAQEVRQIAQEDSRAVEPDEDSDPPRLAMEARVRGPAPEGGIRWTSTGSSST
jgi:hypothetical protein